MGYLRLVQPQADKATVEALTILLEKAKQGGVVGFAYVALHQGGQYSGDVIGRARRFPIYALGLVRKLENLIDQLAP